jgi:DNA-binding FadR family transcriptional regulator
VIAEAREAFEPVMAQLAASRISPERLVELEQSITDMAEGIEDTEIYLDANRRFHNIIAWASGNALFGHLVDVMGGAMDISGAAHGIQYPVKRRQAVLKAHQEIFEAIRDSEPELAEKSMRAHIDEYMVYASRKYPDALDTPIRW